MHFKSALWKKKGSFKIERTVTYVCTSQISWRESCHWYSSSFRIRHFWFFFKKKQKKKNVCVSFISSKVWKKKKDYKSTNLSNNVKMQSRWLVVQNWFKLGQFFWNNFSDKYSRTFFHAKTCFSVTVSIEYNSLTSVLFLYIR